jgi:molybdopterin converting factor small subunit
MAVTVKTLRPLADWMGSGKIVIEWPGGTLEDLIHYLAETKWSGLEKELRGEDGSLAYLFSVNGKVHRELSTVIHDGDEIFVFAPMGGG